MKRLALIAASAAAIFAMTVPTLAAPFIPSVAPNFETQDANKDGMLTFDEVHNAYPTLPKVLFNQADSDDDGFLDEAEFMSLQGLNASFDTTRSNAPSPA